MQLGLVQAGAAGALAPSTAAPFGRPAVPFQAELAEAKKPSPSADKLKVAQLNVWNMFDPDDDPDTADTVVPEAEYRVRLKKLALTITKELGTPDVISINEIENQRVLDDLLAEPALKKLGYRSVIEQNNDGRGIRVALLYRTDRLELKGTEAPNPKMSFKGDAGRGQIDSSLLYARPPLVADFAVRGAEQAADGAGMITIVSNHFKSKLGGAGPEARRQMQGEYLGGFLDARAAAMPRRAVLVVGDLNATYEDGAYKKLAGRKDGSVRFTDVPMSIPEDDRYTYIYRGQKDMLDHMLVSSGLHDALVGAKIPHVNTAPGARNEKLNPKVVAGISDHDPIIAEFDLSRIWAAAQAVQPAR